MEGGVVVGNKESIKGIGSMRRGESTKTLLSSGSKHNMASLHTYHEEEKEGLVDYINALLYKQRRPINTKTNEIFDLIKDGILLCRLVNAIQPGAIDENKINSKDRLSIFEKGENLMVALQAAQEVFNIPLVNIGVQDLLEGRPVLVLSVLWQLINIDLRSRVRIFSKNVAYLLSDEEDGAGADDVMSYEEETSMSQGEVGEELKIILRWVNHHLAAAGAEIRVHNFSSHFKDSVAFTVLLNQLAPNMCSLDALNELNLMMRASLVLQSADSIGCRKFLNAADITQGNSRLIFAFLAYLFTRFSKPQEMTAADNRLQEQAIQLDDIHKEIKVAEEKLNKAQDDFKKEGIQVALKREEAEQEEKTLQAKVAHLEIQRKAQNEALSAKLFDLKQAVDTAHAHQLPSVAELTAAIAAVSAEQEVILKEREEKREIIEGLKDDLTTRSESRKREEALLDRVNTEVKTMEDEHTAKTKAITARIDALGLPALQKKLDQAISQTTAVNKENKTLVETRKDLVDKMESESGNRSKASRARLRVEEELAKAKKSASEAATTKAATVTATTRLERKLVDLKSEIGTTKKDIILINYQTESAKEDTEKVLDETSVVVSEKKKLALTKEQLEEARDKLENNVEEEKALTERQVQKLKEKNEDELEKDRKVNAIEIEKHTVQNEVVSKELINVLAEMSAKQVQIEVTSSVVDVRTEAVRGVQREIEVIRVDAREMERQATKLDKINNNTQKYVAEEQEKEEEREKQTGELRKENEAAKASVRDRIKKYADMGKVARTTDSQVQQACAEADLTTSALSETLRNERSLKTTLNENKRVGRGAEEEERKRGVVLEGKAHDHMMKMNKEKDNYEKKIREITGGNSKVHEGNLEIEAELAADVKRLRTEQKALEIKEKSLSEGIAEVVADQSDVRATNKASQARARLTSVLDDRKREVGNESKALTQAHKAALNSK